MSRSRYKLSLIHINHVFLGICWPKVNIAKSIKSAEEVGQLISELSRELSTNEIALFSIVLSAEFGQKNLHSTENKSEKNINIKIFLQNLKCCSTTTKDLVISAEISEVNFILNVIFMFEISRLPATCWLKSKYVYNV